MYTSIYRGPDFDFGGDPATQATQTTSNYGKPRQSTSKYGKLRQTTSKYGKLRQTTANYVKLRQRTLGLWVVWVACFLKKF